jgi:hypothetical protein
LVIKVRTGVGPEIGDLTLASFGVQRQHLFEITPFERRQIVGAKLVHRHYVVLLARHDILIGTVVSSALSRQRRGHFAPIASNGILPEPFPNGWARSIPKLWTRY